MRNTKKGHIFVAMHCTAFIPLEKTIHFRAGYKSAVENSGIMQPSLFVRGQGSLTGFALAELLTVIVIIAFFLTLAAALVPSMDRAEESARRALCADRLRQIGAAMVVYSDSHDGYLPWYGGQDPFYPNELFRCMPDYPPNPYDNCPGDDEIHPFNAFRNAPADKWIDPATGQPRPFRLGCLYKSGVVNDPRLFYCPSETDRFYKYESYTNPLAPNTSTEWGTLPQQINTGGFGNQYVRTGYCYYPTSPDTPFNLFWDAPMYTVRTFDQMDTQMPYLTDRIWKRTPDEIYANAPRQISHRVGGVYGVNALFKDGHIFYCDNQDVFNHFVWAEFEDSAIRYQTFFYKVFKAIGRCSRGEDPWP